MPARPTTDAPGGAAQHLEQVNGPTQLSRRLLCAGLDLLLTIRRRLVPGETPGDYIGWLRHRLQTTPYWKSGHAELAVVSLSENDVDTAYASAQAVLALEPGSPVGEGLLGRCYLRRGAHERAEHHLRSALSQSPGDAGLREDLAAVLMARADFAAASSELTGIPERSRTAAVVAAIDYCRSKIADTGN